MPDAGETLPFPSTIVPELKRRCEKAWYAGDYETVVFNALKVLENHIAGAIGEAELIGVDLIKKALAPGTGKLKLRDHPAEQEGLYHTVRGLFLLLRNPSAHKFVSYVPHEADAILRFVDFLLESLNRAIAAHEDKVDIKQGFSPTSSRM